MILFANSVVADDTIDARSETSSSPPNGIDGVRTAVASTDSLRPVHVSSPTVRRFIVCAHDTNSERAHYLQMTRLMQKRNLLIPAKWYRWLVSRLKVLDAPFHVSSPVAKRSSCFVHRSSIIACAQSTICELAGCRRHS